MAVWVHRAEFGSIEAAVRTTQFYMSMGEINLADEPHHLLHVEGALAAIDGEHAWPTFLWRRAAKSSTLIRRSCAGLHFLEQTLQTVPQAVHLIDQMQDDRDAFVIDAEVFT